MNRQATVRTLGGLRINVTPLVDILLVLVILFMILTPTGRSSFPGSLPRRGDGGPGQQGVLVLQIGPDGRLTLNRQPVAEGEFASRLSLLLAPRRDRVLFVDADDRTPYGTLIRVLDRCRGPEGPLTLGFMVEEGPGPERGEGIR